MRNRFDHGTLQWSGDNFCHSFPFFSVFVWCSDIIGTGEKQQREFFQEAEERETFFPRKTFIKIINKLKRALSLLSFRARRCSKYKVHGECHGLSWIFRYLFVQSWRESRHRIAFTYHMISWAIWDILACSPRALFICWFSFQPLTTNISLSFREKRNLNAAWEVSLAQFWREEFFWSKQNAAAHQPRLTKCVTNRESRVFHICHLIASSNNYMKKRISQKAPRVVDYSEIH